MSVGLSPESKYLIVEQFQSCGNKTKTGELYDVSPRTVGRIINEYNWINEIENPIYMTIFKEMNALVMPDTVIADLDIGVLEDVLIKQDFIDKDMSIDEFISSYEETISELIDRIESTTVAVLDIEINDGLSEEAIQAFDDEVFADPELYDDEYEDDIQDYEWQLVATAQSITITRTGDDGTDSVEIAKGSDNFRKAWGIIREVDMSEEEQVAIAAEEIYTMADPKLAIEKFTQGKITVDVKNETLYYDGNELHNSLTNRIINMTMNRGVEGGQALLNFLEKLMENPSFRAVNSLYDFLQHNDIEIADNGNFYAWKKVRPDFKDCYTGTIDNSVGMEPSMPRNMVNEDPEQTCSHGLHVAAKHYIGCFGGSIVLKCEVDPRNVVAIPRDYNNSKMRTCGYKVVEDVTHTQYWGD